MPQSCRRKKVRRDKARPQSGREPVLVRKRTPAIMRAPPPLSCFPSKPASGFVPAAVSAAAFSDASRLLAARLLPFVAAWPLPRFYASRAAHRRRHYRHLAGVTRSSVYNHQKRRRRHQRRIHDQRRARYRPHLRESKQHLYLGWLLRGRCNCGYADKQQSPLPWERPSPYCYRCVQRWNEDFRTTRTRRQHCLQIESGK